ncbi:MAG: efflux RND transporter periplasmic adaptor subunit [Azospirillaceae bacterium]|nr:efflux RND transporter periplasmic adaptor subunit [Azospirillaceae bacterium]
MTIPHPIRWGAGALVLTALATWAATGHAPQGAAPEEPAAAHHDGDDEALLPLTDQQIAAAHIATIAAGPGTLVRRVRVTGTVAADPDHVAHIAARVPGVVTVLAKNPGDPVAAGETVAVLESAEAAQAQADHLAAREQEALAQATATREEALWRQRISAEQDYLQARSALAEARIRTRRTAQALTAMGLAEGGGLRRPELRGLRRLDLKAPFAGHVVERKATKGESLSAEAEIYVIADLAHVTVEAAVYAADLGQVAVGAPVRLTGPGGATATGRVTRVGPAIDPATGAARVVIAPEGAAWRPGGFVTGEIETGREAAALALPRAAIRTVEGQTVAFVRVPGGFERRQVRLGRDDGQTVAVLAGVAAGEQVATGNAFVLQAEAGKAAAGHEH